jgi:hypothetical protein
MKIIVSSLSCLLVGIALGWYAGYSRPVAKANREAMKQFVVMDADDSMAAAIAVRAIPLIQAGENQKAVEGLVRPIGMFYRYRKTRVSTEAHSNLLARIEQLAASNQAVATEINRKIE